MFHCFNVSVSGVAFFLNLHCLLPYLLYHYSMFHYVNVPLFYVALLMLHYVNVALFTVPPFSVVLY